MKLTPEQQKLVESLRPYLITMAARKCPGDEDARSVAFEAACRAAKRYKPDRGTSFKTYCVWFVRGTLKDYIRGKLQNRERMKTNCPPITVPVNNPGIEEFEIEDLLTVLPKRDRQMFRLWHLDNYTLQQISNMYSISRERVRQIIERCKARLRRELDGEPSSNTSGRM